MLGGLVLAIVAATVEFDVVGVDGMTVRGELRELTSDRVVVRTSAGELKTLPQSQVVRISQPGVNPVAAEPLGAWVLLTDGGRLMGKGFSTAGGTATIPLIEAPDARIPTTAVRAVRLKPMPPEMVSAFDQLAAREVTADCVVIREGANLDYLEGVLGDFGPESFAFTLDGEGLTVKRAKAEGLIYYQARRAATEPPFCTISDAAGSKLVVAAAEVADGSVKLRTSNGAEWSLPLAHVVGIEFPAQYLSGFKPEAIEFTPRVPSSPTIAAAVAQFYRPRFDRAMGNGPLRLGGRDYARGLAIRSRTELTFLLPNPFSKFTATAGIDDRVRPAGRVKLVIRGDDRVLLEQEITGDDEPLPISLDVTGVVRLKILVDYGADDSESGDHLDLCDPRLYQ
jgi:hypothetical protein